MQPLVGRDNPSDMPEALKPYSHFIAAAAGTATYAMIYLVTGLLSEPPPVGRARAKLFVNSLVGFIAGFPAAVFLGPAIAGWLQVTDEVVRLGLVYAVGVSFIRLFPIALGQLEKWLGRKLTGAAE